MVEHSVRQLAWTLQKYSCCERPKKEKRCVDYGDGQLNDESATSKNEEEERRGGRRGGRKKISILDIWVEIGI